MDNHIASLRSKLEQDPDSPRWLKTVHGIPAGADASAITAPAALPPFSHWHQNGVLE